MEIAPVLNDAPARDAFIENRTFDEIALGDNAMLVRSVTQNDIDLLAIVSGDANPSHLDPDFAVTDPFHAIVGHGMWSGALISAVLGTRLPGPGTIYYAQDLQSPSPLLIGETITTTVTVLEKSAVDHAVVLRCRCTSTLGQEVATGTAPAQAPVVKVRRLRMELPDVQLSRHERFRLLLARAVGGLPVSVAVAHSCDAASLGAVVEAAEAKLIVPILVGPEAKIRFVALTASLDISGYRVVDAPHSHEAALQAVALVRAGDAHERLTAH